MPALPVRTFNLANSVRLAIGTGDITKAAVDGIVNAANERMLGGGGVDGAIHRAAGGELYKACLDVPEVRRGVRCPTGEARITKGFDLLAKYVIHTVGPIYRDDEESQPLLAAAHRNSLNLASEKGLESIAFPAISCGVFGYPIRKAAKVAVQGCIDFSERAENQSLQKIDFVLFSADIYNAWIRAAEELLPEPKAEEKEEGDGGGAAKAADAATADGEGETKTEKKETTEEKEAATSTTAADAAPADGEGEKKNDKEEPREGKETAATVDAAATTSKTPNEGEGEKETCPAAEVKKQDLITAEPMEEAEKKDEGGSLKRKAKAREDGTNKVIEDQQRGGEQAPALSHGEAKEKEKIEKEAASEPLPPLKKMAKEENKVGTKGEEGAGATDSRPAGTTTTTSSEPAGETKQ